MVALTIAGLNNGADDLAHIEEVATSIQSTAVDRLGRMKLTLQGAIDSIKSLTPRGGWTAGTDYDAKDLVEHAGTWYICVRAHKASGVFVTDAVYWQIHQGLTAADLSAPDGADGVGRGDGTVAGALEQLDRLSEVEPSHRNPVQRIAFDSLPVGIRPSTIAIRGAATAVVVASGALSVVSNWAVSEDAVYPSLTFGEGRIIFAVARGKFMLGFRIGPTGAGWRVWSSDGAKVELGYVNAIGGATNLIPAINMPGVAGDYVNIEVEIGPMAQGAGVNLRAWIDGAGRPAAAGATVTFGADGSNGMVHMNEGQIKIESFGSVPALVKSVTIDDGARDSVLVCGQAEFVGRWLPRYEWGANCMSTIRQGSSFRCRVRGTDRLSAAFAAPLGMTQYPVLAVYVDDRPPKFVEVNLSSSGFLNLVSGLDPTRTHSVEVFISGIHESDPKWLKGAGLQIQRLIAYDGIVTPWRDARPRWLFIGDSIPEGIAAKNTPGVSLPVNSVGEASYPVLTARALGAAPVMNAFGGSGLTVGGNGGVPDARTNAFYHMNDRKIGPENIARIFVHEGTNDGGAGVSAAAFEAALMLFVAKLRSTHPGARIYLIRPFNGMYAANIAYAATVNGAAFVDTSGWLTAAHFKDGTHLTPDGHVTAAGRLIAFVRNDINQNG